jgi:hypothetical protein
MFRSNYFNCYLMAVMVIFPMGFICSCKQSDKVDVSKVDLSIDAESAAKAVRIAVTNWTITNGSKPIASTQLLDAVDTLAGNVRTAITNEVYVETVIAAAAIKQILDQGHLPGVSKGEHGDISFDAGPLVISNVAVAMTYPASRTLHLVKDGETSTNNYVLVKQTKDSEWKLQKAWLTDSNGQVIQEWRVQ